MAPAAQMFGVQPTDIVLGAHSNLTSTERRLVLLSGPLAISPPHMELPSPSP
jgi:hypothetical protein